MCMCACFLHYLFITWLYTYYLTFLVFGNNLLFSCITIIFAQKETQLV